jgi:hypothetical protein
MTTAEKIRAKQALCEVIAEIIENQIDWQKKSMSEKYHKNEETGEWETLIKTEDEYSDYEKAKLNAYDVIENTLAKLI